MIIQANMPAPAYPAVVDRLEFPQYFDRGVSVFQHGADPTGLRDSTEAFEKTMQDCYESGRTMYIPAGEYRITRELYPKCSMIGESADSVNLNFYHAAGGRSIRLYSDVIRPDHLAETVNLQSERAGINDQGAMMSYVTCTNPAEAAIFSAGEYVHVAFGKNPFDADDHLFRYHVIWRIEKVDLATGRVHLNGMIDEPVGSDGFYPGSPYYAAPFWKPTTAYTVGTVVYANLGENNPNYQGLFRCTAAGTSKTGTIESDVGAAGAPKWERITYLLGGLYNAPRLDSRPIIQKVKPIERRTYSGFSMHWKGEGDALLAMDLKGVVFSEVRNVNFIGRYAIGMQVNEGSNFVKVRDINQIGRGVFGVSMFRAFGIYSARNITFDNYVSNAGSDIDDVQPIIFAESFSKNILIQNCYFTRGKQFSGRGIFLTSGCEVSLVNNSFMGFSMPFRSNKLEVASVDPNLFHDGKIVHCKGNFFSISAADFRYAGEFSKIEFWQDNRFHIGYTSADHPDTIIFDAPTYDTIDLTFTPVPNGALQGPRIIDPSPFAGYADMVVLAAEVFYKDPPAGASCDVRFFRLKKGDIGPNDGTKLFAQDGAINRRIVTDQKPYAYMDTKNGTTSAVLLASRGDRLLVDQYNTPVTNSGTVTVRYHVLIDRKYPKTNPIYYGQLRPSTEEVYGY